MPYIEYFVNKKSYIQIIHQIKKLPDFLSREFLFLKNRWLNLYKKGV